MFLYVDMLENSEFNDGYTTYNKNKVVFFWSLSGVWDVGLGLETKT